MARFWLRMGDAMRNIVRTGLAILPLLLAPVAGCAATGTDAGEAFGPPGPTGGGKADSSAEATFRVFTFDGEVVAGSWGLARRQIEDQLLYTIGQLNGDRSVGRLDKLELENVTEEPLETGRLVRYRARLLVAWGRRNRVPERYTFVLPRDVTYAGQEAFLDKYGDKCVEYGAHDVTTGSFWYYYRPERSGCRFDDEDVVRAEATVTPSDVETSGKFPEYDMVWEDGVLRVLAVFGKYEDGAERNSDAGIAAYNRFLREVRAELRRRGELRTEPADLPGDPGVRVPEVHMEVTLDEGHRVVLDALLVDNVRTAGPQFDARYGELSQRADFIVYNGHAGLGANIRALARKGQWVRGQYAIVFMNGCDTYAYVDSALFEAHAAVNPDDPNGTKYLDMVTNAMPSFFRSMPRATMAMLRGLLAYDAPRTYERIFEDVDPAQVVLVTGEQDNDYVPGAEDDEEQPGDGAADWEGIDMSGPVMRGEEVRVETPRLAPGPYVFEMTGSGDADLYVRVGEAPTTERYDCRPYRPDSNETCRVELPADAVVHVMVRGYSASSSFRLVGRPGE